MSERTTAPRRWIRRAARHLLYSPVTASCAAGHRVAWRRYVDRHPPRRWAPAGGPVVIVAPHPDDETLGAGGVALLHRQAGDPVSVVVVTNGAATGAIDGDRAAITSVREKETSRAVDALGARVIRLKADEGRWRLDEVTPELARAVTGAAILYAPSIVDYHAEHRRVAVALARVVGASSRVRMMELGVPLSPILVNVVADVGAVAAEKRRALEAHASQRRALEPLERLARYRAALYGPGEVEVFWETSGAGYHALATMEGRSFRGLRARPFSDALTLTAGLRARQRLRTELRRARPRDRFRSPDARRG